MQRDANYFAALPYRTSNSLDNSNDMYVVQIHEFAQCRGVGKTMELAQQDLKTSLRIAINTALTNNLAVPLPTHQDESKFKAIWDASVSSLLDALRAQGVQVKADASADALTLAAAIVKASAKPKKSKRKAQAA